MKIKTIIISVLCLIVLIACDEKRAEVGIQYKQMLKDAFVKKKGEGRSIPLTIENATELDGTLTQDGLYFFYASDKERGNYDIYLRELSNITTRRITSHPSRDFSPAISPDGKRLAFVSLREDPQGDIYVLKLDPEKLISESATSIDALPALDKNARNITQLEDPQTGVIQVIKDDKPSWSPDSKYLAFSSARGGMENIWICENDGDNARQLTTSGGIYPRFSPDGTQIIFVSYREGTRNGDVYSIDIASGKETRLTSTDAIELYPTYLSNTDEIVYTLIDRDTNRDGSLNLKDSSVLCYKNLKTGISYPLTFYSQSSFAPRWFPVFSLAFPGKKKINFNGVLLYSEQAGNNINVIIVPEYGIIPKKYTAAEQYDLAETYLLKYNDSEKFLAALLRVYFFFGQESDIQSRIYVARALRDAIDANYEQRQRGAANELMQLLQTYAPGKDSYAYITLEAIRAEQSGKSPSKIYTEALQRLQQKPSLKDSLPFILEDLATYYRKKGRKKEAIATYTRLIHAYPGYKRIFYSKYNLALLTFTSPEQTLPAALIDVISRGDAYRKQRVLSHVIAVIRKEKSIARREQYIAHVRDNIKALEKKEQGRLKSLVAACEYLLGEAARLRGDRREAKRRLEQALSYLKRSELLYYQTNMLLAQIAQDEGNNAAKEQYYFNITDNYNVYLRQDGFRQVIRWLVDYYEDQGAKAEAAGNFSKAVSFYERYKKVIRKINTLGILRDIYDNYGSRAHILYIDAAIESSDNKTKQFTALEKEYSNRTRTNLARLNFDKAYFYGLAYLYAHMGFFHEELPAQERRPVSGQNDSQSVSSEVPVQEALSYYRKSLEQIEWALFMDDTFVDPYLLKGWLYQYIEYKRTAGSPTVRKLYDGFFSHFLLEKNIRLYEQALQSNNEVKFPEKEGNLHLNIANSYFLLTNYPKALYHYQQASLLKQSFNSKKEEALFYFHLGYCYWQDAKLTEARREMQKAYHVYNILAGTRQQRLYADQFLVLYRYFALFDRMQGNDAQAISWYQKILRLSTEYSLSIDQARYMQEIAFCYERQADYENALSYLSRSEKELKKYDDDEKQYELRMKLFGLGPFPVWNMGPDNFIVGEGHIYSELDTRQKQLLNFEMQYQAYFQQGAYNDAIAYLKKKLKVQKKRSYLLYTSGRTRTINAIGYTYFLLGNHKEAEKYFDDAWSVASDNDDLQGMFVSILNVTNLYSFLLENRPTYFAKPVTAVERLVTRITTYKKEYKEKKYVSELNKLEKALEVKQEVVTEKRKQELETEVERLASDIYFRLDIAAATLDFYKAEYLQQQPVNRSIHEKSEELYTYTRDVFNTYVACADIFEHTLEQQLEKISSPMKVILLLNAATCREKTDFIQHANELYSEAEEICETYQHVTLLPEVYLQEAEFFREYGSRLKLDGKRMAGTYYRKAIALIEKHPELFTKQVAKTQKIYMSYARFLAEEGDAYTALLMREKGRSMARLSYVYQLSPKFRRQGDMELFSSYKEQLVRLQALYTRQSELLASGAVGDDSELQTLHSRQQQLEEQISRLQEKAVSRSSVFSLFFKKPAKALPVYANYRVYDFQLGTSTLHAWLLQNGKVTYEQIAVTPATFASGAADFIKKHGAGGTQETFIILQDELMGTRMPDLDATSYMYVASIEDLAFLPQRVALRKKENVKSLEENFPEVYKNRMEMLLHYAIIQDEKNSYETMTAALFEGRLRPSVLVKKGKTFNEEATLLFYAALYAGASMVIFTQESVASTDFDISTLRQGEHVIAVGQYTDFEEKQDSSLSAQRSLSAYQEALRNYDYDEAFFQLARWKESVAKDDYHTLRYSYYLAKIYELQGRLDKAMAQLRVTSLEQQQKDPLSDEIFSYYIYLLLKQGKVGLAREVALKNASYGEVTAHGDYRYYQAIFTLDATGDIDPELLAGLPSATMLSQDMLLHLLAQYLLLYEHDTLAEKTAEQISNSYYAGIEDILSLVVARPSFVPEFPDIARTRPFQLLMTNSRNEQLLENIVDAAEDYGRYDATSVYAFLIGMTRLREQHNINDLVLLEKIINEDELLQQANPFAAVMLFSRLSKLYYEMDMLPLSLHYADLTAELAAKNRMGALHSYTLFMKSRILTRLHRYKEAYTLLEKLEHINIQESGFYPTYLLLRIENELYRGRISDAQKYMDVYTFSETADLATLYVLKAYMERTKILADKNYAPQGFVTYEQDMLQALDYINPASVRSRYFRSDLFEEGMQFLISFHMKKGEYLKALYYVELKKQLHIWTLVAGRKKGEEIPASLLNEFTGTGQSTAEQQKFLSLLHENPKLYLQKKIPFLPLAEIQKRVSQDTLIIVLSRNEDDIFIWIIDREYIEPLYLPKGYQQAEDLVRLYTTQMARHAHTVAVSQSLDKLFAKVGRFFANKQRLLFVSDRFLEQLPLGLMGKKKMLIETHSIAYASSLSLLGKMEEEKKQLVDRNLGYMYNKDMSVADELEALAIKESGMELERSVTRSSFLHVQVPVYYDPLAKMFIAGDENVEGLAAGKELIFYSSADFKVRDETGFALLHALYGVKHICIGKTYYRDVNTAFIVGNFYKQVHFHVPIEQSLAESIEAIMKKRKYKHPAYWSGTRLYLKGL